MIGAAIEIAGFAIVEGVLSRATVDHLLTSLKHIHDTGSVRKRGGPSLTGYGETVPEIGCI